MHADKATDLPLATLIEALDMHPDAVAVFDYELRLRYVNRIAAEHLRSAAIDPKAVIGNSALDVLPHLCTGEWEHALREAARTREVVVFEHDSPTLNRWTETRIVPTASAITTYTRDVVNDITDRRRRERDAALLAEAGRVLAESLDFRTTLNAVAQLVTPTLADWCSVVVVNSNGALESLAVSHADPEKVRWAREISERYPPQPDASYGPPNVVRTGKSELHTEISDDSLVAAAQDAEHLELLRRIGMKSVLIVPMIAHGRALGAITLICAESGRSFSEDDLPIVEELARRSALAIENAELFQAAAAANRAKSEFLASISHELRTPLNAIIGYVELLSEGISGPVTPAQQDQLLRVRASAGHLLGLIDEVLSFSRMEAGHERVSLQDVAVSGVLEEAAALVRPMAAAKKLPVIIEPPPPDLRVHTDLLKLRQMIVNLLTNAVKFTDSGSVTLSAVADADTIHINVQDTGIGISATHLRSVFEPFWQVEQNASRRVGGTGLGLSVTRRLARLLGGDVQVASAPGTGSTFVITLPRALLPGH